jgi:protein phosphatase
VRWSAQTDRGRVRPNNEDAFLALALDAREVRLLGKSGELPLGDADLVFAVSDGMGGAKSGEFASRFAVDRITRLLPPRFRRGVANTPTEHFTTTLAEVFAAIHHDLLRLGFAYEECAGMGATLTLAWLTPTRLFFAHLGDSRLYRRSADGTLAQLTHDHTHVGWLRRQGQLNEREARTHPRRNALTQALGAGHQFIAPQLGSLDLAPGDRVLLCTDGLVDGLWDRRLAEILSDSEQPNATAAQRLVATAVADSGRDNTTAVVVDLVAPSPIAARRR